MIAMPAKNESPYWRGDRQAFYGKVDLASGGRVRKRLGRDYDRAVLKLQQLRDDEDKIRRGVVTRIELQVADNGLLKVADLLKEFCDELKGSRRTPGYIREIRGTVTRYAEAAKVRSVNQASTASIERHLSGMLERGRSTETRNKAGTRLSTFFSWCVDRRYLAENPADGISRIRSDGGVDSPRALTRDELEALLGATPNPRRRVAYMLGAMAGLRVEEAYRLQWRHVDLGAGWLRLDGAITKNGRGADLPINERLAGAIKAMPATGAKVCGAKPPSRYTWLRDLKRAGIIDTKPGVLSGNWSEDDLVGYRDERGRVLSRRCLRHTYGTMLAAAGVYPQTACKLMRHSNPEITMKFYTDARLLDLRGAVDKLDNRIEASGDSMGSVGHQLNPKHSHTTKHAPNKVKSANG